MRARVWALLVVTSFAAVTGCSRSERPAAEVDLTRTGACADAFFWASTDSGDVAVTVTVDARNRSTEEPTTIAVNAEGSDATIEILRGENLHLNFCNDIVDPRSQPASSHHAVDGDGTIELDPHRSGMVRGSLRLDGLEADDGTRFAPIRVDSVKIGFYAG